MHKYEVWSEMKYNFPVIIEAGSESEAVEIYRRKYAGITDRSFYAREIA